MSAAIAMAPSPAPHERSTYQSELSAPAGATASISPSDQRSAVAPSASSSSSLGPSAPIQRHGSSSPKGGVAVGAKSSPSGPRSTIANPKIIVKKEPGSPGMPTSRHRPRKLDLKNTNASGANSATRPLTAREGLGIQEVGIACLSPGFVTQDPVMKEQLQRSLSVRDQQRHLIEARLHQQSAKGDGPSEREKELPPQFAAKTPGMSRRNKAPPGLSIVAPSHEQFANERVIQSAPLGHSFTGRQHPTPFTRHIANQPSNLSSTSHIHHVPANQTNNRLPPLSDVFGQGLPTHPESATHSTLYPNPPSSRGPMASPGHPSAAQHQVHPGRPREYKSAEEAQQELAGGRPELLPKLVHYGGHQPPTPPSPAPGSRPSDPSRSASKRRTRAEYEDGSSPPLGHGPAATRRGPFGAGRDSPDTQRQKRDEFLRLCERAWDLFHS
ncbi:hypothetical protein S7711_00296 [Stachybotrys chartarum IBT 7711]|uniref:Uncharacterized protein n=1 Tax=Stachybotrys chartarum (strain CBS 109288 / IBT 7711) TaxID=1280523 RepID=A0A084B9A6_STACB|nr:hypothetical protein S7711_00296 [Stachybotrys chartarum IBT 7711]KFA55509.1 hypothetical protein S40293_02086 [Stachybotrys chartarum IBT 40293]KFA70814.1 hypothetical protein S40288_09659 [Stachybotrys chartarum IBT 40288]